MKPTPTMTIRWLIVLSTLFFFAGSVAWAQEEPTGPSPVERLVITGTSVESLPSIELRLYGRDAQGNPLDLSQEQLTILHNNAPTGPITYQGAQHTGTLTVFLIDIPEGVAAQLPALQDAIIQYASPGNMEEQVDSMAVYQVGAAGANQLLAPTGFYNAVRNLFADPLAPETGATALYDSTVALLDQMESLKPNPNMATSIVLMTDGTDAVSRNTAVGVIERAAELGIPVHTVWLNNTALGENVPGQTYLSELAAGTGGITAKLENAADMPVIWNRIAGFRDQARIRYTVNGLTGGTFPVLVALTDNSAVGAETSVEIPNNIPSVVLDVPADSRTLSLPNLEPVRLRFSAAVSWLDGTEHALQAAQLIVNGDTSMPYEVPLDSLDDFVADVANLTYGNNTVEVVVLDDQGITASSPTVILTVNEGRRDIPADLNGGGGFLSTLLRLLVVVVVGVIIAGGLLYLWQRGSLRMPKGRRERRGSRGRGDASVAETAVAMGSPTGVKAYFDVLEAVSHTAPSVEISGTYVRIGRAPAQCDIAFEDDITVSRIHANLQLEGADYRIFDENSTSGTFVNELQVGEFGVQLLDGDEVHLGAVTLRYRRV